MLYLSQACAILVCALVPTLMTFMGRMPGMVMGDEPGGRRVYESVVTRGPAVKSWEVGSKWGGVVVVGSMHKGGV